MPFQSSALTRATEFLVVPACFTAVVIYIVLPIRLLFGIITFRR